MFIYLLKKEVKVQIKNIGIYLIILFVGILFISEFKPPVDDYPLQPMDEQHYLYYTMIRDYKNGATKELEPYLYKTSLTDHNKMVLKEAIITMYPLWSEDKKVDYVIEKEFKLSDKEFQQLMSKIDTELGSRTYYGEQYRSYFYSMYWTSHFGMKRGDDLDTAVSTLVSKLNTVIESKRVMRYSVLGFGKFIKLSNDEIIIIKQLIGNIENNHENKTLTFEQLDTNIDKIDDNFGGRTEFSKEFRSSIYLRFRTYEEAKTEFGKIEIEDKITNSYARYLADFMGIIGLVATSLVAAFILPRDRKHKVKELIDIRPFPSTIYILSKLGAVVFLSMVIFYGVAIIATICFARNADLYHYSIDYFAFIKYISVWTFPTVLFSAATSLYISLLFENGIPAILFQTLLFYLTATVQLGNYYFFKPLIRYNEITTNSVYQKYALSILCNRMFITLFSGLVVFLTIRLHSRRRTAGNGWISTLLQYHKI